MHVVQAFPPNIAEIKKKFPITVNTVYTYGNILYNPSGQEIPDHLMKHEETHERQQAAIGKDQWWEMYLSNKGFRLEQEIEAYREQYKFIKQYFNRDDRRWLLKKLATDLASPLYGDIIKMHEAKEIIENG